MSCNRPAVSALFARPLALLAAALAAGGTASVLLPGVGLAQVVEGAQPGTEEQHPTLTLGDVQPHWVLILDPVFPHLIASKVYIVDLDTLSYKGMINTGYLPNLALEPDGSAFHVAETYWSRGTRGERSDMITTYDMETLDPVNETALPQGRFLVVPKRQNVDLTTDGRYLLSYNMDPAMAVSLVDLQEQRYLGEIEIPGCGLALPTGPRSFASVCPDGSFSQVSFDPQGEAEVREGEPWFDAEGDPVFEHPAMHRPSGRAFFISYSGKVYPVTLRDGEASVGESWQVQGNGDDGWRPGGWQLAAFHGGSNRLFVLMHQGGEWTHKQAGEEIWVFDVTSHRRLARIELEHGSHSLTVTQDGQPLIVALSEGASIAVFDGESYEHKGDKEGIGDSPYLLYVRGE
jgi:methylamine dehydrogenase heavy chain